MLVFSKKGGLKISQSPYVRVCVGCRKLPFGREEPSVSLTSKLYAEKRLMMVVLGAKHSANDSFFIPIVDRNGMNQ